MNQSTTTPAALKPEPTRKQQVVGGLVLGLIAVVVIGAFSGDDEPETAVAGPAPVVQIPVVQAELPNPADVPPPAPPAAPAAPAGPVTSFGTGTHVVGEDIEPGTYKANPTGTCYWARLSSTADEGDIIANHLAEGPTTVTIKKGDAAFVSSRCGTWQKR